MKIRGSETLSESRKSEDKKTLKTAQKRRLKVRETEADVYTEKQMIDEVHERGIIEVDLKYINRSRIRGKTIGDASSHSLTARCDGKEVMIGRESASPG